MSGSSYGKIFKVTTWGESHGKGLGVVVDGVPAGIELSENDIQLFLNRRKPGQSKFTTPRKEDDAVEILSGVFEGKTTGTPVSVRSHLITDQVMLISALMKNMVSGITVVVDVHPAVRRSAVWQQVLSQ